MSQTGKLELNGEVFDLEAGRDSRFYIFDSDENEGTITIALDLSFQQKKYKEEFLSPSFCINGHETGVSRVEEIIGHVFRVDTLEEADEREDTFYLYEHEPIEKYAFSISEMKGREVHIQMKGIAITDGYADPYKTAEFSVDCWLAID